jgi:predicted RNase H-like nuclease (RuvC/YqgF family)
VVSLRLKDLNVVSFFSGLITSKFHIAPNFVISLFLDQNENPKDYLNILPKGAEMVLSEFPVKRFDARTTSFKDVLSNIGQSYTRTLPKLYNALLNHEIEVKPDMGDFLANIARDLEPTAATPISGSELADLQKKVTEQEGVIKMLQGMLEGKDYSSTSTEYIAKIETMKGQLASFEQRLKEKDTKISEMELQLSRIDLLQTRIQTLQSDIIARDTEIANLRTKLTASTGLPEVISSGAEISTDQAQIWKNKILELQNELLDRNAAINKLKTQLSARFDDEEARSLLTELSSKLGSSASTGDELDNEMKSKYINL